MRANSVGEQPFCLVATLLSHGAATPPFVPVVAEPRRASPCLSQCAHVGALVPPPRPPAHPARTLCSAAGSVPESIIGELYKNAFKALKPGGRLLVHDFMVNDSLDSPALGALWALQHVTVNASGLGLCPSEVGTRMTAAGFTGVETMEMIHGMTKLIVAHKK